MKKLYSILVLGLLLLPQVTLAQPFAQQYEFGSPRITSISGVVGAILSLIRSFVPVIFALAMLYFLWGVVEYVTKAGEEKKEATEKIVGGLIALAVMFSVYGLVRVVQGTFPLDVRKIESVQL